MLELYNENITVDIEGHEDIENIPDSKYHLCLSLHGLTDQERHNKTNLHEHKAQCEKCKKLTRPRHQENKAEDGFLCDNCI